MFELSHLIVLGPSSHDEKKVHIPILYVNAPWLFFKVHMKTFSILKSHHQVLKSPIVNRNTQSFRNTSRKEINKNILIY